MEKHATSVRIVLKSSGFAKFIKNPFDLVFGICRRLTVFEVVLKGFEVVLKIFLGANFYHFLPKNSLREPNLSNTLTIFKILLDTPSQHHQWVIQILNWMH